MSARCCIILLGLYLCFQKGWTDAGLSVTTVLQYNMNDPDSVGVICQYEKQKDWDMFVKLKNGNSETVCETNKVPKCKWSQEEKQTTFILKNVTSDQINREYHCQVYRRYPVPVMEGRGVNFRLFPETHILPNSSCKDVDLDKACPSPEVLRTDPLFWAWALIGLMLLLCFYSLIITVLYIKLKINSSEDINSTMTYVPMQNHAKPRNHVRQHNADKNAEYMDMRKVHPHAGPMRDMNHNSHQIPSVFTM